MAEPLGYDDALAAARTLVPAAGRVLLGLAGAPGAGKSSLAARLVAALGPAAVVVPMDGFHHSAADLHARGQSEVKGAPETFDRAGYVDLLRRLRVEENGIVRAPAFDRSLDEPVPDAVTVGPSVRLVVTEGNYLLHWQEVRALLDEVWFVRVRDDRRRTELLVARHVSFGRNAAAARAWVARSDEANVRLVAADRSLADRVVSVW